MVDPFHEELILVQRNYRSLLRCLFCHYYLPNKFIAIQFVVTDWCVSSTTLPHHLNLLSAKANSQTSPSSLPSFSTTHSIIPSLLESSLNNSSPSSVAMAQWLANLGATMSPIGGLTNRNDMAKNVDVWENQP